MGLATKIEKLMTNMKVASGSLKRERERERCLSELQEVVEPWVRDLRF